jgi:hypothetical protein
VVAPVRRPPGGVEAVVERVEEVGRGLKGEVAGGRELPTETAVAGDVRLATQAPVEVRRGRGLERHPVDDAR